MKRYWVSRSGSKRDPSLASRGPIGVTGAEYETAIKMRSWNQKKPNILWLIMACTTIFQLGEWFTVSIIIRSTQINLNISIWRSGEIEFVKSRLTEQPISIWLVGLTRLKFDDLKLRQHYHQIYTQRDYSLTRWLVSFVILILFPM